MNKAILKERPFFKKRILWSDIEHNGSSGTCPTKVKAIYSEDFGWVAKFRRKSFFIPEELIAIAKKLEEYNKNDKKR